MDPITAFGIASGVAQLIDFSIKIIKFGRDFQNLHGQLPGDLVRVELLVDDLLPMVQRIQQLPRSPHGLNSLLSQEAFESLIIGCLEEIRTLHELLQGLEINVSENGLSGLRAALRLMRRSGKIANIEKSLDKYRNAISARLSESTHENQ